MIRKINIDKLPKFTGGCIGKHNGNIDWFNSKNIILDFIYDEIIGEIEIVDIVKPKNAIYLYIKYQNKIHYTSCSNIINCRLSTILNNRKTEFIYDIGDIIKGRYSQIEILEQIRTKYYNKNNRKFYKYKCLKCSYENNINESILVKNVGCPVCANKKVMLGVNDMWTTDSYMAKNLANPSDGYKYTKCSAVKVDWICPDCGNIIKNKAISKIYTYGLKCPYCGDGISYPEKFVINVLNQLNIEFEYQKTFDWLKNRIYDFYFIFNNNEYIIETDGIFHIIDNTMSKQTKEESKIIDNYKDEMAYKNNIKIIRINCIRSELKYIKNSIIESELSKLFDLSNIDWLKCHENGCKSMVKEVCESYNKGYNINELILIFPICKNTVRNYLKQGAEINWCNYNPKNY